MNDNTKVSDQNPVSGIQVQPIAPVGSANKEAESDLSEFIRPVGSEVSPNLSPEEEKAGIEVESNKPELTPQHKELGIDHAGPDIPVPSSPSGKVTMPMSEEEVVDKLKTGRDDDSGKWLARLINKVIAVMRFKIS